MITQENEFIPTLENVTGLVKRDDINRSNSFSADFGGNNLTSVFQPIFSYALHRQVGFEGLVRGTDQTGNLIMPNQILRGSSINELLAIDRLCRSLHLANYRQVMDSNDSWLFLNVNPLIVSEIVPNRTPFMKEILELYNIPPERIVIEILETAITNETKFIETVNYYREIGCLIAIDDFGAGHSNFNRIWNCHPDFVKLDRSIIENTSKNPKLSKSIPKVVGLLHDYGCMVLAEGIETIDQAIMCMDAEFDLIQGFLFSEPITLDEVDSQDKEIWHVLKDKFRNHSSYRSSKQDDFLAPYIEEFHAVCMSIKNERSIKKSCVRLLEMNNVLRFYVINSDGEQKNSNIDSSFAVSNFDKHYLPLQAIESATWYHRQYFRKAISNIGKVQITGPYFSITDAYPVYTLSIARKLDEEYLVFCCDIKA